MPAPDWPVFRHATLDSTSDEARRLVVSGGVSPPFVVRADRQTKGRGRGANVWWSDDGSLLFTVAIDPRASGLEMRHEPRLALVAALGVIEAIEAVSPGIDSRIRWPNDVEVAGHKIAGVLPERCEAEAGVRLLVGVGINVSTRFDDAPPDIRRLATSVVDEADAPFPEPARLLSATFDEFIGAFSALLSELAADDPRMPPRWNVLDALAGQRIRVRQVDRIVEGIGRGIDAEGALLIETDRGPETIVGGQVLRT